MSEERSPNRRVEFNELNWLGKSVFLGGTVLRLTANLVDAAADRVSHVAEESRKAFEREVDPNIEEAHVLEEYPASERPDSGT